LFKVQNFSFVTDDQFVNKLWNVYKKAQKEGYNQKVSVSIFFTQYRLTQNDTVDPLNIQSYKINASQIETASIECNKIMMSDMVSKMHK
jgi:hypothetical protein